MFSSKDSQQTISMELEGFRKLSTMLARSPEIVNRRTAIIKNIEARRYREDVVARAPKDTGDYASGIAVQEGSVGNPAIVYSNHPAGPRLEYGFVGNDSLGRHYNQPGQPHWRPALEKSSERFAETVAREIRRIIKRGN